MNYSEKLQDPRWQKLRLEIMSRDGFSCRYCRSSQKTLNVHHSYYKKGFNPWDYPNDSLVTVCKDCHQLVEYRRQSILEATSNPVIQQSISVISDAIGGMVSLYPKRSRDLVENVAEFLRYSANCNDDDPEEVSFMLDTIAMGIIRCLCDMKHGVWQDRLAATRPSLDDLIAMAPDHLNGGEAES